MSLKINVIYNGIIYRVKGMKVLCSVVLAVIILLIAIVAMGVWMLVSVYDEGSKSNVTEHLTTDTEPLSRADISTSAAPSIDFKSTHELIYSDLPKLTTDSKRFLKKETPSVVAPPEPNLSVFGAGLFDARQEAPDDDQELVESKKDTKTEFIPSRRLIPSENNVESIFDYEESPNLWNENVEDVMKLPSHLIPKNINTAFGDTPEEPFEDDQLPVESSDYSIYHNIKYPEEISHVPEGFTVLKSGPSDDEFLPLEDINAPTAVPKITSTEFAHRSGAPHSREGLIYNGPPVVGYGSHPYKKISKERLEEYDSFWKTYGGKRSPITLRDHGNTNVNNGPTRIGIRPHLRGLRPTEEKYDGPLRPDAQVPSEDPSRRKTSKPPQPQRYRPIPHPSNYPPPPRGDRRPFPPPRRRVPPPHFSPNRKLYVGDRDPLPPPRVKVTPRPSGPVLGPLQELYDYSKRLAASLLSFNTKSDDRIKETSDKLAQHGIKLIEDYNNVFKKPTGGPLDTIAALIPSTERLRSLDPFQLSLITWTFLDFWEFIIEKVGTLSNDDLQLLQERLIKLRKRKDSVMTQALVNETVSKMSSESQRSISSELSVNMTALKQLIDDDDKKKEFTDKFFEDIDKAPINISSIQGNFLGDLFPQLSFVEVNQPISEENRNETEDNVTIATTPDDITSTEIPEDIGQTAIVPEQEEYLDVNDTSKDNNATTTPPPSEVAVWNETDVVGATGFESRALKEESRMWDPLGLFSSQGRMQFMQFAVKVVFNFGKVYLKKPYALDCLMLLFCKDLNQDTKQGGVEGIAAKLKSVGLKVLTESDQELRQSDTFGEIWRSVTAWTPLQCDAMFPRCDGSKALEIVNEVALGSNN